MLLISSKKIKNLAYIVIKTRVLEGGKNIHVCTSRNECRGEVWDQVKKKDGKQDRQYTYSVTLRGFRATTVAVAKQQI